MLKITGYVMKLAPLAVWPRWPPPWPSTAWRSCSSSRSSWATSTSA
jgi:hypothetical protein